MSFLIVLDINRTLLAKINKSDKQTLNKIDKNRLYKTEHNYLVLRDNTSIFVDFLDSHSLDYVIWSTALHHNIEKMMGLLKQAGYTRPLGILSQSECAEGVVTDKIKAKLNVKNLEVPARLFNRDISNCILVDDSEEKHVNGQNYLKVKEIDLFGEDTELIRIGFEFDKFVGCEEDCDIKRAWGSLKIGNEMVR